MADREFAVVKFFVPRPKGFADKAYGFAIVLDEAGNHTDVEVRFAPNGRLPGDSTVPEQGDTIEFTRESRPSRKNHGRFDHAAANWTLIEAKQATVAEATTHADSSPSPEEKLAAEATTALALLQSEVDIRHTLKVIRVTKTEGQEKLEFETIWRGTDVLELSFCLPRNDLGYDPLGYGATPGGKSEWGHIIQRLTPEGWKTISDPRTPSAQLPSPASVG